MTAHDEHLIDLAQSTSTGYDYIASLIPMAESEECRQRLRELEDEAFGCAERIAFEIYD